MKTVNRSRRREQAQDVQAAAEDAQARALYRLLLQLPAHVFLFDRQLVCRFAAPYGPHFLGRPAHELISAPATEVFAPVAPIVPRLSAAIDSGVAWAHPFMPVPAGPEGSWAASFWQVHVQPWSDVMVQFPREQEQAHSRRAPAVNTETTPSVSGAVVSCQPVDAEEIVASRAQAAVDVRAEGQRSAQLLERIRTKLTVIRGNADLLERRELRAGQPRPRELERVQDAVNEADRLLREYELASHLTTRHPDLE